MTKVPSGRSQAVATVRDLGATALVLGFVGVTCFGWSQVGSPASWVPFLIVGSTVGAIVAVLALILAMKHRKGASAMRGAGGSRAYRWAVIIEVGAIAAGAAALGLTGHAAYIPPWVLFIVGVHFLPLGNLFRIQSLRMCGLLVAAVAVIAPIVGVTGDVPPSAVAGAGGGGLMVIFGAYTLLRGCREHAQAPRNRAAVTAA